MGAVSSRDGRTAPPGCLPRGAAGGAASVGPGARLLVVGFRAWVHGCAQVLEVGHVGLHLRPGLVTLGEHVLLGISDVDDLLPDPRRPRTEERSVGKERVST